MKIIVSTEPCESCTYNGERCLKGYVLPYILRGYRCPDYECRYGNDSLPEKVRL